MKRLFIISLILFFSASYGIAGPMIISGTGVTDGDKGDVTVSGSGATWTVDSGLDAAKIGGGGVTTTEFGYIGGLTSDAQIQITAAVPTATNIGALVNGATAKVAPVDADYFGLMDSEATNILKKLSWAYVKSLLWASPQITGLPTVSNGATSAGYMDFKEDSDNGTNRVRLIGPASTADVEVTLPAATGTVAVVKTEKLAVFNIPGTSADGTVVDSYIPVASTITGWVISTSGAACSAVVDIWAQAYADFPPENAQSIAASALPTLSTAQMNKDTTLTGWTTALAADSFIRANLDSSDCAGNIQVTIIGTK